jgi:hypothetical protein
MSDEREQRGKKLDSFRLTLVPHSSLLSLRLKCADQALKHSSALCVVLELIETGARRR